MKFLTFLLGSFLVQPLYAATTEMGYVVNTLAMLICAALIMWMAAGFCMLEAGLVRRKSTAVICLKNILIYSIACLCFYLLGYNLMFSDVGGFLGSFQIFANVGSDEMAMAMGGSTVNTDEVVRKNEYSSIGLVFFQMTFVAAAASVISGALAERVKLWSFFIFVAILTGLIYPIQGAWTWGGGWLGQMGFADFAGSTVVHSVGGWAALSGALFLGPRFDKYDEHGYVKTYFPSSVPLVTLGVFILWFGWLGFNGGSLLVTYGVAAISKMSLIFINTNLAACAGAVVALFMGHILHKRINILSVLNGALAGLVSITAGPEGVAPVVAVIVGAIGSCLATLTPSLLDRFRIDDVVGAIPVHLVAGIWGTLAVGIWGSASFITQFIGVVAIGAFVLGTSSLVWFVLKKTIGIRVSEDKEDLGQDLLELGLESDPDVYHPIGTLG